MKDAKKIVKKIIETLFEKLTLDVKITAEEEGENTIKIGLETENPGLLIGYHGETLSSFQLVASLILYKETGKWIHLSINIGDYRERREEQLRSMVSKTAEEVKTSGNPQALPFLPSNERRLVHLIVQEDPDLISESEGEGLNRRLIIKKKTVV